jgi:hypothetical protein
LRSNPLGLRITVKTLLVFVEKEIRNDA